MIALLFAACTLEPSDTVMIGAVYSAHTDGVPVANATVETRNEMGEPLAIATTDNDGMFEVQLPSTQMFFVTVSGDDYVPTSYAGIAGTDALLLNEGELWLRSETKLDNIRQEFSDCDGFDTAGGVIEGEVRLLVVLQDDLESLPLVTTALLVAYDSNGIAHSACYLPEDEDPGGDTKETEESNAQVTGSTGRFAFFGVPAGPTDIDIQYDFGGSEPVSSWHYVYVPEEGTVPMYPALVNLPGP